MRLCSALAIASLAVVAVGCTDESQPTGVPRHVVSHATVYTAAVSGPTELGSLVPGDPFNNIPWGINDLGDIVGVTGNAASGVLWPTGTGVAASSLTPDVVLETVAADPRDVNASGDVVGAYADHAALWKKGLSGYVRYPIADFGAVYSAAYGINAVGQVVGLYSPGGGVLRCFVWTPSAPNGTAGTTIDIGDLGGGQCVANDINSSGQVTGASKTSLAPLSPAHAFVWRGSFVDLSPAGGESYGVAINEAGQVAGWRNPGGVPTNAVVWTPTGPGSWSQLDVVAPPLTGQSGPVASAATDIDDAGFVIGYTSQQSPSSVDRGFFWQGGVFSELPATSATVPFSEPTAMSNLVGGVVVVAGGEITDNDANTRKAVRWAVTLTPVVTQGCLEQLAALVRQMQAAGTLSTGEAKSLLAKVDAAARQAAQGKAIPAKNVLLAFINEVNALVASGRLTAAAAQPLIDGALCAIGEL